MKRKLSYLLLLVFYVGCATNKMEYISKDYELYGTWVNPEYDEPGRPWPSKADFHPNGRAYLYHNSSDTKPIGSFDFVITNNWIDKNGDIYYTLIVLIGDDVYYELFKISNSGTFLEIDSSKQDYPLTMDNKDPMFDAGYHYFYRQ